MRVILGVVLLSVVSHGLGAMYHYNGGTLKTNNSLVILPTLDETFFDSFDLKLDSFLNSDYNSVLVFTSEVYDQQILEVYTFRKLLHVAFGIRSELNAIIFKFKPSPLGQWTSIFISQYLKANNIYFKISVNEATYELQNLSPETFTNVNVYAGDPWRETQNGSIKRLVVISYPDGAMYHYNRGTLKTNNPLVILPTLDETFFISFDLKLDNFLNLDRNSVLVFTSKVYDQRILEVYTFWKLLYVAFGRSSELGPIKYKFKPSPLGQWTSIFISQYLKANNIYYKISVNEATYEEQSLNPETFTNVNIYAGDPWRETQDGSIKRLVVISYPDGEFCFILSKV
nr:uncharacterized protein LOC124811010 [Hydra vulgaris]